MAEGYKCDCCSRPDQPVVGVASSSLGPMSFAFCRQCVEHNAEPEFMFRFTLDCCGKDVAAWVQQNLSTYVNGKYLTWDEWVWDKEPDPHAFDGDK